MGCKLTSQDEGTEMLGTSGFQSASKMKCGKGGKTSHLPSSRMKTIHSLLRRRRLVMCFWIQCFICSKICPFFCQHPQDMNLSLGRVCIQSLYGRNSSWCSTVHGPVTCSMQGQHQSLPAGLCWQQALLWSRSRGNGYVGVEKAFFSYLHSPGLAGLFPAAGPLPFVRHFLVRMNKLQNGSLKLQQWWLVWLVYQLSSDELWIVMERVEFSSKYKPSIALFKDWLQSTWKLMSPCKEKIGRLQRLCREGAIGHTAFFVGQDCANKGWLKLMALSVWQKLQGLRETFSCIVLHRH